MSTQANLMYYWNNSLNVLKKIKEPSMCFTSKLQTEFAKLLVQTPLNVIMEQQQCNLWDTFLKVIKRI
jgi:hypothetical protein